MDPKVAVWVVLIQKRWFLMGTNAVQGSTGKIDRLSDWFCQ